MTDPADGPFGTREQAEIRFTRFCHAALTGRSGPPGEELVHPPGCLEYDTLADTLDTAGVELGEFDLEVLGQVAGLGPLAAAVVNSLFQRAARDDYDPAVYIAIRPRRHLRAVRGNPSRSEETGAR